MLPLTPGDRLQTRHRHTKPVGWDGRQAVCARCTRNVNRFYVLTWALSPHVSCYLPAVLQLKRREAPVTSTSPDETSLPPEHKHSVLNCRPLSSLLYGSLTLAFPQNKSPENTPSSPQSHSPIMGTGACLAGKAD